MSKSIVEQEKELATYSEEDRVISFREMQKELEKQPKGFIVHSYFPHLERLIEGFREGELIVVSGKAKSGKSLFCQTLTSHFAIKGEQVLWFSYEVPARQFLETFPDLPQGYMPRQMELGNISWLEERIYESKLKYNTNLIFVDHLHYLVDMSRMRNPSLEIGTLLRRLKLMARKYRVVIFIICHTGKIPRGEEPTGESIRDSSFVLQEPDIVLILWRLVDNPDESIENEGRLKVEMTRRTGVFSKIIKIKKIDGYLEEIQ